MVPYLYQLVNLKRHNEYRIWSLCTVRDQMRGDLFESCGAHSSNYEAKAKAIEASLHHLSKIFDQQVKQSNNIDIFSDAKSVQEALRNEDLKEMTSMELTRMITNFIAAQTIHITLQWVPGPTNIHGNDHVDKLASK